MTRCVMSFATVQIVFVTGKLVVDVTGNVAGYLTHYLAGYLSEYLVGCPAYDMSHYVA